MAAANESQGLKIAVAAFIALSVILSVASYFLYSAYSSADAKLQTTTDSLNQAKKAASDALNQYQDMRGKIGTKNEDYDAAKEEITTHSKKINERFDGIIAKTNEAISKVQGGGAGQEFQDTRDKIQQIIQSFRSDNSKTYSSSLDRLTELMENLSMLSTELSLNYVDLRHQLESATSVGKAQTDIQTKAAETSRADLDAEHKKHEEERKILVDKVTDQQTSIDQKTTENANLQKTIRDLKDDYAREKDTLTSIIRELRDQVERKETILDHPDGYITFVDYDRGEVQLNINRSMGARPQMVMSIFDAHAPGIPTEKPKGSIELTKVGEQFSIARIIKTVNSIDPIRTGDIVYSPAWSPNNPTRFALVGKIDVNRDGRDDREELKRMIQEAGGVVDFDLPPLEVGKETGKLTPRIDWYVTDDRIPFHEVFLQRNAPMLKNEAQLKERMGQVIKEARLDGIRPMPIGRLLSFLGYDINTPVVGRAEAVNTSAIRRLTAERPQPNAIMTKPAARKAEMEGDETATPKADAKKAEENDEPK
ncbi:MAG: coiled-coil domain-containing protein [Isosphaeraceae bacterium]